MVESFRNRRTYWSFTSQRQMRMVLVAFLLRKRWQWADRVGVVLRVSMVATVAVTPSLVHAEDEPIDRSWRLSGGVSLLPGNDGGSQVGYGLTLSRSASRRTAYGVEITSSFGSNSGDDDGTRIHTLVGGFLNQSLYAAQGISISAGLSAGVAIANVRERSGDVETDSTESYPYVEPKLSASLSLPDGGSRFSGSIGWITLPGEDFSEPRFSFGFSF